MLAEAIYSGQGLVIAGEANRRNSHIERTTGLILTGQNKKAQGVVLPEGVLGAGLPELVVHPSLMLDVTHCGADILAHYQAPVGKGSPTGQANRDCPEASEAHPAVVIHGYGEGKSAFVAFDPVADALNGGTEGDIYSLLILHLLDAVQPDAFTAIGGEVVPVSVQVNNLGIEADIQVTSVLNNDVTVIDTGSQWQRNANGQPVWAFSLEEEASGLSTLYLKLLSDQPITLQWVIEAAQPGEPLAPYETVTTQLAPASAPDYLAEALQLINTAGLYKFIRKKLEDAQSHVQAGQPEKAIQPMLLAVDELMDATDDPRQQLRILIAKALLTTVRLTQ